MERVIPRRSKVLMGISGILMGVTIAFGVAGIREIGIVAGLVGMMCLILAITESWV